MKKIFISIALLYSSLTFAQTSGGPTSGSLPINENLSVLFVSFIAIVTGLYLMNYKKSV